MKTPWTFEIFPDGFVVIYNSDNFVVGVIGNDDNPKQNNVLVAAAICSKINIPVN